MADYVSDLKVGAKLGNGAFGEVFRGEDPAHGVVAVKVLKRELFHNDAVWPIFKAGYLGEAKNLAKATHRNVVQIYHVVEAPDGDSVVICMSFCPGGSLQTAFESGPMSLSGVRKVGNEVLMGARCHAHEGHGPSRRQARQHPPRASSLKSESRDSRWR